MYKFENNILKFIFKNIKIIPESWVTDIVGKVLANKFILNPLKRWLLLIVFAIPVAPQAAVYPVNKFQV